ncbi:MAG: GH3 auxin-responsive promoter family protein [Anaerolineae bacterium]|nr:GH3 auxin-responsive promoter family protein [Anaerolineae bacterium]
MSEHTSAGMAQMEAILQTVVKDWYDSLNDPAPAQERVLHKLLKGYAQTRDGQAHGAANIETLEDYRRAFPARTYEDYLPLLNQVYAGDIDTLLYQEPIGIAMTRGTTGDTPKLIPMTPDDLNTRPSASRAVLNYILRTKQFDILEGVNLNLGFPSRLNAMRVGDKDIDVGYSSGIYIRHVSSKTMITSLPTMDELDALGGDQEVSAWDRRFELAYQTAKDANVTILGGVVNVFLKFGRYLHKNYGMRPKDIWQARLMTLGSAPRISTKWAPALHANWGSQAAILEIYGTTEGMFGQQKDDHKAWSPNYDLFFLEVEVGGRTKMLHEMQPGEVGSLIVSTVILPRYKIGDLIRAYRPPYFRCIGREHPLTPWRAWWEDLLYLDFGRI